MKEFIWTNLDSKFHQQIPVWFQALLENKGDRVVGVGISTGGRVDSESGEILFATQILNGWSGVALRKYVQNNLGLPCYVENDGNCAALAELHFGKHSLDSFVMFHFGTGIGWYAML